MRSKFAGAALLSCAIAIAAVLAGCKSQPVVIPDTLSAAETFQRAQDASDRGDFALAIRYYSTFKDKHPENAERDAWASYEIAFAYHKMGKNAIAIGFLDDLLKQYETGNDSLPPAPRILAQKLKDRLSVTVKTGS